MRCQLQVALPPKTVMENSCARGYNSTAAAAADYPFVDETRPFVLDAERSRERVKLVKSPTRALREN